MLLDSCFVSVQYVLANYKRAPKFFFKKKKDMSIKMSFHAIVQLKFHSRQLELCSLASFTEACANCRTSYPNYVGLTNKHLTFYGAFHNVALICQRYFQTSQIFNEIKSNISTIQFSNITQWKWVRQGPWNTEICSSVSTVASVLKVTVYPLENKFVWKNRTTTTGAEWCWSLKVTDLTYVWILIV